MLNVDSNIKFRVKVGPDGLLVSCQFAKSAIPPPVPVSVPAMRGATRESDNEDEDGDEVGGSRRFSTEAQFASRVHCLQMPYVTSN